MALITHRLGLGQTFVGLIAEPRSTIEILFQHPKYPYPSTIFGLFLICVFLPFAIQIHALKIPITRPEVVAGLACTLFFTLLVFLLLEHLLLILLRYDITLLQLYAITAYAMVPAIVCVACIWGFNLLIDGDFTLVNYALTGYSRVNRQFMAFIPLAVVIAHLASFFVFAFGIEYVGRTYLFTAICATVFSAIPFYTAILIALYIAESAIPGTYQALIDAVLPGGRWFAEQWRVFKHML